MKASKATILHAEFLAARVAELEWGTERQIETFNELCNVAIAHGLESELEDYAHGATDTEISNWIVHQLVQF